MPLYEYKCKKCGNKFEKLVSMSKADDPMECPKCKSDESERLLSTFSASVGSNSPGKGASCNTSGT